MADAQLKAKIVLKEEAIKVIKAVSDERLGNVNPIKDFNAGQIPESQKALMSALLSINGVGKVLDSPQIAQIVKQGYPIAPVPKALAEKLEEQGLCTIVEVEQEMLQEKEPEKTKKDVTQDDTGSLATLEDQEKSKIEVTEEKDDKKKFAPEQEGSISNPELDKFNAQLEETDKKMKEAKTEEEKDKLAEQIKEIVHERDEKIGKMYYLTPERIIENLEKMNGGRLFKTLFNTPEKRYAVIRAYSTCSDPNLLTNPHFLDDRINQFLPEGEKGEEFKGIHKLLLANTYVGYHVEEANENQKTEEQETKMDEKANNTDVHVAMLGFPEFVSDMPEGMKQEIRDRGYDFIKKAIADVVLSNNSYTAICVVSDMDTLISKGLESLEKEAGNDQKGKATKAYVKTLDEDFRRESRKDFSEIFDFEITFTAEELENDSTRAQTMALLKMMDNNSQGNVVDNAIKSVQVDIVVRDSNDVEKVRNIAKSLGDVGTRADINFAIDTSDPDTWNSLRDDLEEVHRTSNGNVNLYEDVSTERSMAADREFAAAVQTAANMGIAIAAGAAVGDLMNDSMGTTIGTMTMASMGMTPEQINEEIMDTQEDELSEVEATALDFANDVSRGIYDKDYAIYLLSMAADIPPELAERMLEENIEQSAQEEEHNYESYDTDSYNTEDN